MMHVARLLGAAVAVTLSAASAGAKEKGAVAEAVPSVGGAREVVLDEKTVGKAIEVRTARNLLTTVEFPEDMLGAPTCGDCTDGKNPDSEALFRIEPVAQGRYLAFTPTGRRTGN
jgi:hypothetical protein